MKKLNLVTYFVLILIFLFACGSTYRIGTETFDSSSEALQRQNIILSDILKEITPIQKPVGGTALVLVPSDGENRRKYIKGGNIYTSKEKLDYVTTSIRNNNQFMADAIDKRRMFDSISVDYHNGNPSSFFTGNNDFVVFKDVDGWFIKYKNKSSIIPIPLDKNKPIGTPRTQAFLDSLYEQAQTLKGKQ